MDNATTVYYGLPAEVRLKIRRQATAWPRIVKMGQRDGARMRAEKSRVCAAESAQSQLAVMLPGLGRSGSHRAACRTRPNSDARALGFIM